MGQRRKKRKKQKKVKLTKVIWQINAEEWLLFKTQEVTDMKKEFKKHIHLFVFTGLVILLAFLFVNPLVAFIMFIVFFIIGQIVKKRVVKPFHKTINKPVVHFDLN